MASLFYLSEDLVLPSLCPVPKLQKKIAWTMEPLESTSKDRFHQENWLPICPLPRAFQWEPCFKVYHHSMDKIDKGQISSCVLTCSFHQIGGSFLGFHKVSVAQLCKADIFSYVHLLAWRFLQLLSEVGSVDPCWCSSSVLEQPPIAP